MMATTWIADSDRRTRVAGLNVFKAEITRQLIHMRCLMPACFKMALARWRDMMVTATAKSFSTIELCQIS